MYHNNHAFEQTWARTNKQRTLIFHLPWADLLNSIRDHRSNGNNLSSGCTISLHSLILPLCYFLLSLFLHILLSFTYSFPFCVGVSTCFCDVARTYECASLFPSPHLRLYFFFVTVLPLLKPIYPLSINVIFCERNSLPSRHRTTIYYVNPTWGGSDILSWAGTPAQV